MTADKPQHVNPGLDATIDPTFHPDTYRSAKYPKTAIGLVKENFEPWELLDMLCWADVVLHVQYSKDAEDVGFCKGESCNYCGKFDKEVEHRAGERK